MHSTTLAAPTPRRHDLLTRLRHAWQRFYVAPREHARLVESLEGLDRRTLRDIGLEHMVAPPR
jgi:hypothetical protein